MPIEVQPFAITAENLWGDNGAGVDDFLNNFANHVAPNVKMHISGQEFALAGDANGIDQIKTMLKQNLIPAFVGGLDTSKPMQRQITNVIGGGPNNWCAVDMTASGTSKKGAIPLQWSTPIDSSFG